MSEPDLSTLPQRMRYAAEVQREATKRYSREVDATEAMAWGAAGLENWASRWEAEDREAGERDALAKGLFEAICEAVMPGSSAWINADTPIMDDTVNRVVQRLIESGWRKGGPA